ncbi:hypothetical protein CEXT_747731 [Caerostris extrusa]|uniref:Uncharacterized protein n=1 Tax=Caerostris extrusa TaxID=172846 RepID=A0AAV4T8G0_CAEEX|nr:hypothetical protein CEXT_747731 [Caerostris extrusa]
MGFYRLTVKRKTKKSNEFLSLPPTVSQRPLGYKFKRNEKAMGFYRPLTFPIEHLGCPNICPLGFYTSSGETRNEKRNGFLSSLTFPIEHLGSVTPTFWIQVQEKRKSNGFLSSPNSVPWKIWVVPSTFGIQVPVKRKGDGFLSSPSSVPSIIWMPVETKSKGSFPPRS